MKRISNLSSRIERIVCNGGEAEEIRRRKIQFTLFSIFVVPAAFLWGVVYFFSGEPMAALIPESYCVLTTLDLLFLIQFRRYEVYRRIQQVLILLLPFFLHLALGGFVGSSTVIVWSFLAVVGGVLFGTTREAIGWFIAYSIDVVLVALFQPELTVNNEMSHSLVLVLYVLNIVTVSGIAFGVLYSFVQDRRRLRELEVAYLNQEMTLRQSEKLATLGTLAAGLAHELNNPAAAMKRSALQMNDSLLELNRVLRLLSQHQLTETEQEYFDRLFTEINRQSKTLTSIQRSDQEYSIEQFLEERDVDNGWSLAPLFVDAGYDIELIQSISDNLRPEIFPSAIRVLAAQIQCQRLAAEVGAGSSRISDIVTAVKGYSFLDQAPVQNVDVNEGIESTITILKGRLGEGVQVHRSYGELPQIMAHGSELNQVWAHIISNAVDAMQGKGNLKIVTRRQDEHAIIEIEDDGPGIPKEILPRIFDPFFTTKPPGSGTGLGLATSFGIITEKHKGMISARSQPGSTVFTVRLPLQNNQSSVEGK